MQSMQVWCIANVDQYWVDVYVYRQMSIAFCKTVFVLNVENV